MLRALFEKQNQHLDYFFAHLDYEKCEALFEKLKACKGVVFFSGVGKSGFIAQKIAATMMSTGSKAFFLPPIDALHGDLGMVGPDDFVLIFSKSGETEELLELLPALCNKGVTSVAITSDSTSRLAKRADLEIVLPCENELCPFDLAPTTSTEIQLLFGDVLTIGLMKARKFSLAEYAKNHPSGRIGKRATVRVKDLMLNFSKTPTCLPEDRLGDVLNEFSDKRCGCLLVVNELKQLQGIFTDGDLRRGLQQKGDQILNERLGDLMTKVPKSIEVDELAWDAVKLMESDQKHPVMVLPVEEQGAVVGIIKMHDLIQAGV